jgi:hypothetical protein
MESGFFQHPICKTWMMKPVVAINDPCRESWEKMNPEEQGRFCDQCCKVVVDFTKMSNKAIAAYLQHHTEQKTCGRFRTEQVAQLPAKKFRFSFSVQRFAAAVLLAFGSFLFSSCSGVKPHNPEIMGDVSYVAPDTTIRNQAQQTDTLREQHVMGKPVCVPAPDDQNMILGEVMYVPEENQ